MRRLAVGIAVAVMVWEAGRQSVGEYPLASSLSLLIGVGLACAYPIGRSEGWRFVAVIVTCALCVTSVGYGGIVAVAYIAVAEGIKRSWLLAALGVVAAIFVPHEKFARMLDGNAQHDSGACAEDRRQDILGKGDSERRVYARRAEQSDCQLFIYIVADQERG